MFKTLKDLKGQIITNVITTLITLLVIGFFSNLISDSSSLKQENKALKAAISQIQAESLGADIAFKEILAELLTIVKNNMNEEDSVKNLIIQEIRKQETGIESVLNKRIYEQKQLTLPSK